MELTELKQVSKEISNKVKQEIINEFYKYLMTVGGHIVFDESYVYNEDLYGPVDGFLPDPHEYIDAINIMIKNNNIYLTYEDENDEIKTESLLDMNETTILNLGFRIYDENPCYNIRLRKQIGCYPDNLFQNILNFYNNAKNELVENFSKYVKELSNNIYEFTKEDKTDKHYYEVLSFTSTSNLLIGKDYDPYGYGRTGKYVKELDIKEIYDLIDDLK